MLSFQCFVSIFDKLLKKKGKKKISNTIFKFKLLYCDGKPWTVRKLQIAMMKREATDIHFFYQQLKI